MAFINKILFFLFLVMLSLSSCEEGKVIPKKVQDTLNMSDMPDQIGWNTQVNFVDSSFTKAILKAKRARIYQKRNETLLDGGLYVEFLSKTTGRKIRHHTADSARIDDLTKNMLAAGHVIVISDSNQTKLETSLLHWNNKTQLFYSTEFVKITSPKERIQGYGFESDQNLSNYKVFKVSGEQR
jgi:LPS export ABC transporter protein LptC